MSETVEEREVVEGLDEETFTAEEIHTIYMVYGRTPNAAMTWPLVSALDEDDALDVCHEAYEEGQRQVAVVRELADSGVSDDDMKNHESVLDVSRWDPWRLANTGDGDAVYFSVPVSLILSHKDDPRFKKDVVETITSDYAQQRVFLKEDGA